MCDSRSYAHSDKLMSDIRTPFGPRASSAISEPSAGGCCRLLHQFENAPFAWVMAPPRRRGEEQKPSISLHGDKDLQHVAESLTDSFASLQDGPARTGSSTREFPTFLRALHSPMRATRS